MTHKLVLAIHESTALHLKYTTVHVCAQITDNGLPFPKVLHLYESIRQTSRYSISAYMCNHKEFILIVMNSDLHM